MGKQEYTFGNYLWDTFGFLAQILLPFLILVALFRLSLFNIPGVREIYDTIKMRIPGVGEYLMTTFASPGMAKGQFDDFLHPERHPDWATRYEPQMQYRGFLRSMLQTTRGDSSQITKEELMHVFKGGSARIKR